MGYKYMYDESRSATISEREYAKYEIEYMGRGKRIHGETKREEHTYQRGQGSIYEGGKEGCRCWVHKHMEHLIAHTSPNLIPHTTSSPYRANFVCLSN